MPVITLLIVDIDNTLFDWFRFWYSSFNAMIDAVLERVPIDRGLLLREIRDVHQRHKTTEYSWLLQEVPSISRLLEPARQEAIEAGREAFRDARNRTTYLYKGVDTTLRYVKRTGTRIVGFTESQKFYTTQRLLRFGLDQILDALYCAKEHATPPELDIKKIRSQPEDAYELKFTRVTEIHTDARKPDARVLQSIMTDFDARPQETLYVGDSKMKDVYMAQSAGVHDAYAAYGDSMNRDGYDLLRAVSSWSSEEIAKERKMAYEVQPTVTLQHGFSDILEYFTFTGPNSIFAGEAN